ncbi:MAG: metal-dependent transcriptional regulator [Clostridia bacterium]|nr:metal-dependent transcriptional regulator [Clostridia bacterium]
MQLQESGEMYLETILILTRKKPNVRSIDVCEHMGFSKPSVSRAISLLRSGGYVNMDSDGFLTLTDVGLEVAEKIYLRHELLTRFLISIGVSTDTASNDACKIEHCISDESFNAIKKYMKNK